MVATRQSEKPQTRAIRDSVMTGLPNQVRRGKWRPGVFTTRPLRIQIR